MVKNGDSDYFGKEAGIGTKKQKGSSGNG